METMLPRLRFARMFVVLLGLAFCAIADNPGKTPVELWTGGDDGLTQRFADAIRHALNSSPVFFSSSGKKPGSLIVFIPTHVASVKKAGRITIQYTVLFSSVADRELGSSKGTCQSSDAALTKCAVQVVKEAEMVARKVR